ncbi:MoaD/ThiS family protein [Marinobacter manganoxydans]|uniref:Molybdopterin synthase sulfur carrier subunit n=1 Tax=Marinobacter manganoxydans MnI7-9 TaxID=1094979 RepID=G6YNK3_9GAMM|nr:MoaD/ThiS family protein [Marinobacter manganoxydans]EHJ06168.1 molybdopterin converting factor, subunit 1 [Marinobacter manganoxydans MnI7-9]
MSDNTITVRFFARLREELKTDQLTIDARPGLTAGDVLAELADQGGPWSQLQGDQPVMIAINQAMAKPGFEVKAGDELAFFPPVTGG